MSNIIIDLLENEIIRLRRENQLLRETNRNLLLSFCDTGAYDEPGFLQEGENGSTEE